MRGYAQSAKRWLLQAEKYARTHDAVQLRPKVSKDGEGEDEEGGGREDEAGREGAKGGGGVGGGIGGGLKKSGRVVSRVAGAACLGATDCEEVG